MDRVRVGVVGVGMMGQRHCRVYSNLRRAQFVGVCDVSSTTGSQIAEQYEVPFYHQVDDLLKHVDAVSLVTPTPYHYELAMKCLAQGVHVLIEKPITETIEQAEKLTEAAEASRLVVQVGHIERFNPTFTELKHVLEGMTVLAINLRRLSPYLGSNTDVDVVLDLMTHDVDLVLDLMGRSPNSIEAQGLTAFSGAIDHAITHLGYDSGPLLTITASRVTEQKIRSIEIVAQEAYLECDLLNKMILVHRRTTGEYLNHNQRDVKYRQESLIERIHVPSAEPLFLELEHFLECILTGNAPLVSAHDGLKTLHLIETIRGAIHKRMVNLGVWQEESAPKATAVPLPAFS